MILIIHRGTNEIGGSCVELQSGDSRILLDLGMPLVDKNRNKFDSDCIKGKSIDELKRVNILPSVEGLYNNEKSAIKGILISHSHMDHYGLLNFINSEIPVYISQGAKELVEVTNIFTNKKVKISNPHIIKNQESFTIQDFKITPYLVDHSGFDAFAFLIEAEGKKFFYSGDFRGHGRKGVLLYKMIKNPPKDIDCLLMEGSLLGRTGILYETEDKVEARIVEILKEQKNITFLFASSQNIDRLVSAYRACLHTGTIFVIDVYTAYVLQRLEKISGSIPQWNRKQVRVKYFNYHVNKLAKSGFRELVYLYNSQKIQMVEIVKKKKKILMLLKDNSIFRNMIDNLPSSEGSKIIYSMWEGYLTEEFKNYCHDKKIEIEQVHTSGHAAIKDLLRFAEALKPKILVPIHTFKPEKYVELFDNVRQLKDGELLEI